VFESALAIAQLLQSIRRMAILKEDAHTSRRKISDTAQFAVIPSALYPTTISARRFFERRVSRITQAWGSPNTPITVRAGVESGEAVAIPQAFCLD